MKLEKVEFGGVKGRILSQQVVNIFSEFQTLYQLFGERTYNPLDPTDKVVKACLLRIRGKIIFFCVINFFKKNIFILN